MTADITVEPPAIMNRQITSAVLLSLAGTFVSSAQPSGPIHVSQGLLQGIAADDLMIHRGIPFAASSPRATDR